MTKYGKDFYDNPSRLNLHKFNKAKWRLFLINASHNRILYHISKQLHTRGDLTNEQLNDLETIIESGTAWLESFRKTITFLENNLRKKGLEYLVVKTFKYIDYVTFDVDILVQYDAFGYAQNLLKTAGCQILPHPRKQGFHQKNCKKDGLLNIDLHRKFYWQGLEHIDLDFVWKNPTQRIINGIKCICPSIESDLILHTKQLAYERYYVTYLDHYAIKKALAEVEMEKVLEQVDKYKWRGMFDEWLLYIEYIDKHNTPLPFIAPYSTVLRQQREFFANFGTIPAFDLLYYHFTMLRYILSKGRKLPYYDHWYKKL